MSVESYIYFHTKEFFMLHKLAENSDIYRRQKSLMPEIYKHVKIISISYDDEAYDLTNLYTLTLSRSHPSWAVQNICHHIT